MPRPLGRSLDPLPGEDLAGFLLRLSAHLDMMPIRLIKYLGLLPAREQRIDRKLLLTVLPDEALQIMRLMPEEARALTLLDWRDRYPPIAHQIAKDALALRRPGSFDPWLFTPTARHCPRCLAGDGSPVQARYGGPWQRIWRLPIVFACLEHDILLHDGCAADHAERFRPPPLIASGAARALHPAQCRQPQAGQYGRGSVACGRRLDKDDELDGRTQLTPAHRDTQRRILDCFDPRTPAEDSARFLTELRMVTSLLAAVWPATEHLVVPADRQAITESKARPASNNRVDKPPSTSIEAAAIFAAAATVLDDPERLADLANCLRANRIKRPTTESWTKTITRNAPACSPTIRAAMEVLTFDYRRELGGGPRLPRRSPDHPGYRPEHIPAFLEQDWYLEHLAAFGGGRLVPSIRRLAAATLVQWSAGGSRTDAAQYLGFKAAGRKYIPTEGAYRHLSSIDPERFEQAIHDLADQLDSTPTLVDYQRRRQALAEWSLTNDDWNSILDQLPPPDGGHLIIIDDTTWGIASAYIWATATCGEMRYAPRRGRGAYPKQQRTRWPEHRASALWQFLRPDPTHRYRLLRALLREHADRLSDRIDRYLDIR